MESMTQPDLETLENRSAMYRLRAEAAGNCAARARSKDVAQAYSILAESWTKLANSVDLTVPSPPHVPPPEPNGRQAT